MSAKQDRLPARTPADLERKYNFGDSFAEVMGIATDAQKAADAAQESANSVAQKMNPEDIFNILTDNGAVQGIFRGEDGEIYINASYLRSGVISSADGSIIIDLSAGSEGAVFNTGISTNGISVRGDVSGAKEVFSAKAVKKDGVLDPYFDMQIKSATTEAVIARLVELFTDDSHTKSDGVALQLKTSDQHHEIRITVNQAAAGLRFYRDGQEIANLRLGSAADGSPAVALDGVFQINGKVVDWSDNGNGTSTLIGT